MRNKENVGTTNTMKRVGHQDRESEDVTMDCEGQQDSASAPTMPHPAPVPTGWERGME